MNTAVRLLALACLAALLVGGTCHRQAPAVALPATIPAVLGPPVPADLTPGSTAAVNASQATVDRLERELAAARADVRTSKAARDRDRIELLRTIALWTAGVMLLGAPASVVLWFVLPAGTKALVANLGIGCAATSGAALVAYSALAYVATLMPWVLGAGALFAAAGVAWGVYRLAMSSRATREAADHGDRLEAVADTIIGWLPEEDRAAAVARLMRAKVLSADFQRVAKVRTLIARERGKDPNQEVAA